MRKNFIFVCALLILVSCATEQYPEKHSLVKIKELKESADYRQTVYKDDIRNVRVVVSHDFNFKDKTKLPGGIIEAFHNNKMIVRADFFPNTQPNDMVIFSGVSGGILSDGDNIILFATKLETDILNGAGSPNQVIFAVKADRKDLIFEPLKNNEFIEWFTVGKFSAEFK